MVPRLLAALLLVVGLSATAAGQTAVVAEPAAPASPASPPPIAPATPVAVEAAEAAEPPAAPAAATAALLPHELTPYGMFLAADVVVKAVMIGLALASLATWTVWIAKSLELAGARRRLRRASDRLSRADDLDEAMAAAGDGGGPAAAMLRAAAAEVARSGDLPADGIRARVASQLERLQAAAGRRMSRGTGLLATIGSTAPFVGLFGTVWGIMNAFVGISKAQTTNLAVVAPGIAEALLATAIGLVAAIPAVVIYNGFARSIAAYKAGVGDVAAAIERLVSLDLDRRRAASLRPLGRAAE